MSRRRSRFLRKPVEPFTVTAGLSADELLTRMERISFQGRNLATARRIWEIKPNFSSGGKVRDSA